MSERVLVAGVGNIFWGDDGFGVAVAQRLAAEVLPDWVRVVDAGIRGVHLAYELLDAAYEMMILVDATPRGGAPGTVYLIEPDLEHLEMEDGAAPDAHGMHPAAVLSLLHALGGAPGRVLLIGCEPARVEEEIGLSAPVAQAVEAAVALIRELIQRESWTNLTKAG